MTWDRRIARAKWHEQRVADGLRHRGWYVEPFGQALLTEPMRQLLRAVSTSVRWMPDVIAARRVSTSKPSIVYVDAKAGQTFKKTGNHDIEISSLEAAEKWMLFASDGSGSSSYHYVFEDRGVLTPESVRLHGRPGSWRGVGSGTPFLLVPAYHCESFDAVFGPRIEVGESA